MEGFVPGRKGGRIERVFSEVAPGAIRVDNPHIRAVLPREKGGEDVVDITPEEMEAEGIANTDSLTRSAHSDNWRALEIAYRKRERSHMPPQATQESSGETTQEQAPALEPPPSTPEPAAEEPPSPEPTPTAPTSARTGTPPSNPKPGPLKDFIADAKKTHPWTWLAMGAGICGWAWLKYMFSPFWFAGKAFVISQSNTFSDVFKELKKSFSGGGKEKSHGGEGGHKSDHGGGKHH